MKYVYRVYYKGNPEYENWCVSAEDAIRQAKRELGLDTDYYTLEAKVLKDWLCEYECDSEIIGQCTKDEAEAAFRESHNVPETADVIVSYLQTGWRES